MHGMENSAPSHGQRAQPGLDERKDLHLRADVREGPGGKSSSPEKPLLSTLCSAVASFL